MFILIHAFEAETFLDNGAQGPFVVIIIMYSLAILPFTYLLSFFFHSADKAQVAVATIYFLMGIILNFAAWAIRIAVPDKKLSANDKDLLETMLYRVFPTYGMAD